MSLEEVPMDNEGDGGGGGGDDRPPRPPATMQEVRDFDVDVDVDGDDRLAGASSDGAGGAGVGGGADGIVPSRPPPRPMDSMLSLPKKRSGIPGASSNLVNSIVGAGIIGIPYAMKQSGLVAGLIMLGLVGFLTDRSLRVIVNLASFHPALKKCGVYTFEDLASYPFGRWGRGFILANMFVMAYGAMVAYLIIIKDTVPTVFGVAHGKEGGLVREVILVLASLLIVVPLSMQRDMASLSFTSLLSVTADIILVAFVAAFAPIKETVADAGGFGELIKDNWIRHRLFIGLGILSTAMACQHSAFIVSGSLLDRTKLRWKTVTVASITFAAVLCAVMGICGYLGFLDETQGDVLNNFNKDSVAANGARSLLAITMFFTYPMESFVARHVLVMLLHGGDMDAVNNDQGREGGGYFCFNRRQSWTLSIYLAALLPALFLDDLGPVLSITGSLGGSCISYIAPGLVYLGVNGDAFQNLCRRMAENWNHRYDDKKEEDGGRSGAAVPELELPVAGDAGQRLPDANGRPPVPAPAGPADLPIAGERRDLATPTDPGGYGAFSKPFWWYLGGFPVWWAIASSGGMGMREKLAAAAERGGGAQTTAPPFRLEPEVHRHNGPEEEVAAAAIERADAVDDEYLPTRGGFCMAVFFIIFGVVGAVVGVVSNVYVQFAGLAY